MKIEVNSSIAQAPPTVVLPEALEFHFDTPASTWTIQHNLGWSPLVQLVDANGNQFEADVEYLDSNTVMVVHGRPTTGSALLK